VLAEYAVDQQIACRLRQAALVPKDRNIGRESRLDLFGDVVHNIADRRTAKVARTIADLGGSATITTNVAEEIRLRRFERVG